MTDFLTGCSSLFTATFHAAGEVEFFRLLFGYIVVSLGMAIFAVMSKGLRKV